MKHLLPTAALVFTFAACLAPAISAQEEDKIEIAKPSFSLFHEFGSISHGTDMGNLEFDDYFLQRSGVWVNLKATRNDRLTLNATIGGIYWNPTYNENSNSESFLRYFAASAPRASATYVFGDVAAPAVTLEAGMFPYKYNTYTHNLGEYMFRSTAYPTQVFTGGLTWVDVNRAQVTGLRVSEPIGNWFSHDALLTFETDQLPYYDLNLTYMAKAKVGKAFSFTGGVQFARLLPIKESITNPDARNNRYFTYNDTTYLENSDYYDQRLKNNPGGDSLFYVRGSDVNTQLSALINGGLSIGDALDSLGKTNGVTGSTYDNYNMQSTKLVAAFSFDPKALVDLGGTLGPNDLILYGEAALLGVKNYPVLYENRMERAVAMLGLNLPVFRQLEVLAVEVEWFGSRQPNSSAASQASIGKNLQGELQPLPQPSIYSDFLGTGGYNPDDWKKDDIKWSVFTRRQLVKGLNLDVQIASDNARGFVYPSGRRYWAYFREPSDWYWMMKLSANI